MSQLNAIICPKDERKTKVVQFGLNNFLKGTALYVIDAMNESGVFDAGVAVVLANANQDVSGLASQDNLYTTFLQGLLGGEEFEDDQVISSINQIINPYTDFQEFKKLAQLDSVEFVFANAADEECIFDEDDTDLKNPKTFIGKLLSFLKFRFDYYAGDITKGLHIIPCVNGFGNGENIKNYLINLAKKCKLSVDLINWITYSNTYAKCFVDRIIEDADEDSFSEVDYEDTEAIKTEHFYTWVIEGPFGLDKVFPASEATDVEFVENIEPYLDRARKVRCGTRLALAATGKSNTKDAFILIEDFIRDYAQAAAKTVDLLDVELDFYEESLFERYTNPFFVQSLADVKRECVDKAIVSVITQSDEINKHALLVYAYYVNKFEIDLGASPEIYEKLNAIDGAVEFLTSAIEFIKENGFVSAIDTLL